MNKRCSGSIGVCLVTAIAFNALSFCLAQPLASTSASTAVPGYVVYWGIGASAHHSAGVATNGALTYNGALVDDILSVSAGYFHALALRKNRTVLGWAGDRFGEASGVPSLGNNRAVKLVSLHGGVLTNVIAVAAGWNHSLALKGDGTVAVWGMEAGGNTPVRTAESASNIAAIACGITYRVGLTRSGEVIDLYLGRRVPGLSNIVAVSVQQSMHPMGVALLADGTVAMFGTNGMPEYATQIPNRADFVSVACGAHHNLALTRAGNIWGWGSDGMGEATGTMNTNPPYFSAGLVRLKGKELNDVIAVASSDMFSLALLNDGTIRNWGNSYNPSFAIPVGLSNVVAITAGPRFCLAITTNAAVAERFRR